MMRARDNPFATDRVLQLRYQFRTSPDDGLDALLARLESLRFRASIIGPHGSGKTTLLEDLGVHLADRGWHIHSLFLNEQDRAYPLEFLRHSPQFTLHDIILLDGCEQLGPWNWRRFRIWRSGRRVR